MKIPFNKPYVTPRSLELMMDALDRGHVSGDGYYTARASELLRGLIGAKRVLLTTSCTAALEMCALLARFEPGDEVIVPSFTFVSTVNAFVLHGATPRFVDIRPGTLNIDESLIGEAVTERTRAIVVVHYAGIACDMETLTRLAEAKRLLLVEDNAHGLGGLYRDRPLGSFAPLATLSFHETKNVHCGEGGALVLNDDSYVERAEILREKGTDRARYFRGMVDKYTWVDVGSSLLPSDMLAAFLVGQLEAFEHIQTRRLKIWRRYRSALEDWADGADVRLPEVPAGRTHPAHLFYLLLPSRALRDRFIAHMAEHSIHTVFHYVPLHSSPMGRRLAPGAHCPVTDDVSARLVRLPLYPDLEEDQQRQVIDAVRGFVSA